MKGGPRPKPPELIIAHGLPGRAGRVVSLYDDHPDPEDMPPPDWLTPEAKEIWAERLSVYRRRGQKVFGQDHTLAQYCELIASLVKSWQSGRTPVASLALFRQLAIEFYDTPASQRIKIYDSSQKNKFASHAKPDHERKSG